MKKLGANLGRPVGYEGSFSEHAELSTDLGGGGKPTKAARKSKGRKAKKASSIPVDKAAERKAALAYEREQKHREREGAREEAARQKQRARRQQAVARMTGTTLHTVSRILSNWESRGLIESGRQRIVLREPHKLFMLAEATPGEDGPPVRPKR